MKKIITLAAAVFMTLGLAAQNIEESVATIGDLSVPACQVTLQKDAKVVNEAMDQYLKDARLKTKNVDGYVAALQQVVPAVSPAAVNLYTKVTKEKKNTLVTVAVIGNDLTIDQAELRDNAKTWLGNFVTYIGRYEASLQMNIEQQNLKKAEKVASNAASDLASIEKTIANDQKKIADKKQEIEKLKDKIKSCENDIKNLQSDIEKQERKKGEAQRKVDDANKGVNAAQNEVERYRQLSE